jgi:hypothetical protein
MTAKMALKPEDQYVWKVNAAIQAGRLTDAYAIAAEYESGQIEHLTPSTNHRARHTNMPGRADRSRSRWRRGPETAPCRPA